MNMLLIVLIILVAAFAFLRIATYVVGKKEAKRNATREPEAQPIPTVKVKVIKVGKNVLYKQHPRSASPATRQAVVQGFKFSRSGRSLVSLQDSFGNRFSVSPERILA